MPIYKVIPVAWQKPKPKSKSKSKTIFYFPPAEEQIVDFGETLPVQVRSRSVTSKPFRAVLKSPVKPKSLRQVKSIRTHRVVKRDRDNVLLWVSEALRPSQPPAQRDAVLALMAHHGARTLSELRRLSAAQFEAFTLDLFGKLETKKSKSQKSRSKTKTKSWSIPEILETQVNLSKSKSVRIRSPSIRATTARVVPKAASLQVYEPTSMEIQRVQFGQPLIKRNWRDKQLVLDTVQVALSSGSPILKQLVSNQMVNAGVENYSQLKQLPREQFDQFAIAFFLTLEKLEKKS